jgi:hypothetical protein
VSFAGRRVDANDVAAHPARGTASVARAFAVDASLPGAAGVTAAAAVVWIGRDVHTGRAALSGARLAAAAVDANTVAAASSPVGLRNTRRAAGGASLTGPAARLRAADVAPAAGNARKPRAAIGALHAGFAGRLALRGRTAIGATDGPAAPALHGVRLARAVRATGPRRPGRAAATGRTARRPHRISPACPRSVALIVAAIVAAATGVGTARRNVAARPLATRKPARPAQAVARSVTAESLRAAPAVAVGVPRAFAAVAALAARPTRADAAGRALIVAAAAGQTRAAAAATKWRTGVSCGRRTDAVHTAGGGRRHVGRGIALGRPADGVVVIRRARALAVALAVGATTRRSRGRTGRIRDAGADRDTSAAAGRVAARHAAAIARAFTADAVGAEARGALIAPLAGLPRSKLPATPVVAGLPGRALIVARAHAHALGSHAGGRAARDRDAPETGACPVTEAGRNELSVHVARSQLADRVGWVLGTAALAVAHAALATALGFVPPTDAMRIGLARAHGRALAGHSGQIARDASARAGDVATDAVGTEPGRTLSGLGAGRACRPLGSASGARTADALLARSRAAIAGTRARLSSPSRLAATDTRQVSSAFGPAPPSARDNATLVCTVREPHEPTLNNNPTTTQRRWCTNLQ